MNEYVLLEVSEGIARVTLNQPKAFNAFGLDRERDSLAWCADHPNGHEGVAAFLEKRQPTYV